MSERLTEAQRLQKIREETERLREALIPVMHTASVNFTETMNMQTPSVGRVVHYTEYGTRGDKTLDLLCRAAIVTEVDEPHPDDEDPDTRLTLAVFTNNSVKFVRRVYEDQEEQAQHTWHWPERV